MTFKKSEETVVEDMTQFITRDANKMFKYAVAACTPANVKDGEDIEIFLLMYFDEYPDDETLNYIETELIAKTPATELLERHVDYSFAIIDPENIVKKLETDKLEGKNVSGRFMVLSEEEGLQ